MTLPAPGLSSQRSARNGAKSAACGHNAGSFHAVWLKGETASFGPAIPRSCQVSLRVRAKISWHFGASAGWADARRRDAGDVMTSSRSGNAADALLPPRPAGLRPLGMVNLGIFRLKQDAPKIMLELRLGPQQNAKLFLREP